MAFSSLITKAEVISIAFVDQNLNQSKIKDTVLMVAHLEFVKPFLNNDFYDDLMANKTKNAGYIFLISEYLKPALAYYCKYLLEPDISFDAGNKGLQTMSGDFSTSASKDQRTTFRERAKKNAQTIMEEAKRYIEDDENNYFVEYSYSENVSNKVVTKGDIIILKR